MKKIFFLFFLSLFYYTGFCQKRESGLTESFELKSVGDTYVVRIVFRKLVLSDKCNCLGSESQCKLYTGEVKDVLFLPKTKTPFTDALLRDSRYFLAKSSQDIPLDTSCFVTLSPATGYRYLKVNNILKLDKFKRYDFISTVGYLSGFVKCYRIGLLNKLLLKFRIIHPENINYKNKKQEKDVFDGFIRARDS